MIAIVDYGLGNLFSLKSSLDFIGLDTIITNDKSEIKKAKSIILPGVGAFRDAIGKLKEKELDNVIIDEVKNGKILLGICFGMQLLFEKSYEYGEYSGLGLIKGDISPIKNDLQNKNLKVPHMGWNNLKFKENDEILKYIKEDEYVYYVHSYYAKNCEKSILAYSDYEVSIPGIVKNENVYGIQFHPEKSGETGLNILKAFGELI